MSYISSFIAIDLPEKAKQQIGIFQAKLKSQPYPIHWELPENFHLNLLFLGNTKNFILQKLSAALKEEVVKQPFSLRPDHLEYLYKKHGDSIIFISVDGELKKLKELQEQVGRTVKRITGSDPPGRFLPHITIGRLKPYISQQDKKVILGKIIELQPPKTFTKFDVVEIKIMQTNFLSDRSHRYVTFHTIPLRAP
jgi:2'-5' RNA ligase